MTSDRRIRDMFREIFVHYSSDRRFSRRRLLKAFYRIVQNEKIVRFDDKYVISPFIPPLPSRAFVQLAKNTRSRTSPFESLMNAEILGPMSVLISLTAKCAPICPNCITRNLQSGRDLSTAKWKTIIAEIQQFHCGLIGFTGGEALLRDDLEQIIAAVDDRSSTALYTCGAGLSPERALSLKQSGLFSVIITLDSHNRKEHNKKSGGKAAFDEALKAVYNAREAGLYTIAQTVFSINELNADEFARRMKFFKRIKVHEVRILEPYVISGSNRKKSDDEQSPFTNGDREFLIALLRHYNNKPTYPKITSPLLSASSTQFGCGAAIWHSYISQSGELQPCERLPLSFGNVTRKPFSILWSEMSDAFAKPSIGCFAHKAAGLITASKKGLPLSKKDSLRIVAEIADTEWPDLYKILRGVKPRRDTR